MLTREEQDHVRAELIDRLAREQDVRQYITTTFRADHRPILRELRSSLTRPVEQADFVLWYCLDSAWSIQPTCLLDWLLTDLVEEGKPHLVALRDRVRQGPTACPVTAPSDALWLRANMPFFGRAPLRQMIRTLLSEDDQPILRIVGPAGCGKTYTSELFDYVRDEWRRDLRVVPVRLEKGAGPSYRVEDLAEALVAPTVRDIASRPPRATSSYPAALCRWILNAAVQTPAKWIYILDGFNQPDVLDEPRALIQTLALEIASGEFRKQFRLVLLDYDADLPSVQPARIQCEAVPDPMTVSEHDLAACLHAHYRDLATRKGQSQLVARDELRKVAAALLSRAPACQHLRLRHLNTTLTNLRRDDLSRPLP